MKRAITGCRANKAAAMRASSTADVKGEGCARTVVPIAAAGCSCCPDSAMRAKALSCLARCPPRWRTELEDLASVAAGRSCSSERYGNNVRRTADSRSFAIRCRASLAPKASLFVHIKQTISADDFVRQDAIEAHRNQNTHATRQDIPPPTRALLLPDVPSLALPEDEAGCEAVQRDVSGVEGYAAERIRNPFGGGPRLPLWCRQYRLRSCS